MSIRVYGPCEGCNRHSHLAVEERWCSEACRQHKRYRKVYCPTPFTLSMVLSLDFWKGVAMGLALSALLFSGYLGCKWLYAPEPLPARITESPEKP